MSEALINIRNLSLAELTLQLTGFGEPKFRAKQVYEWLWKRNARSFDEMANIGNKLQELLRANYFIDAITVEDKQISTDKTIKLAVF